jgi:hypothetical protein
MAIVLLFPLVDVFALEFGMRKPGAVAGFVDAW